MTEQEQIDDALASELTLFVDGRLPEERRAELEARIAASPELAARVQEQRAIAGRLTAAAGAIGTPARLRARVEADRRPARRGALLWTGGVAAAAAAAALALVLVLPGGSPGGPSVAQAARLGELPANQRPPAPAGPNLLSAEQDGVAFPRWRQQFGWVPVGARAGRVGGRAATTVYYRNPKSGRMAAYTIVGGKGLADPEGAAKRKIKGTDFYLPTLNGNRAVVWKRSGHTCILQGTAPQPKLLQLASWRAQGAIPF